MPSGEFSDPNLPSDEIAPDLGLIWYPEETKRVHFSNLTPDPEAQVDMKTWAKMFSQFQALDQWEEIYAYAKLPSQDVLIEFPAYGLYIDEEPCATVYCSFNEFTGDETATVGRRGFSLSFDLTRPGYVVVHEGNVALPEKISPDERFTDCQPIEGQLREGLYMTSDGSSVGYRFAEHVMSQRTAEAVCDLLSQASFSDEEAHNQRFLDGLENMEPSVREAIHRQYVLGKSISRGPEEAFKETEWSWDHLPTQSGRNPTLGLIADHWDRLEAYATPGTMPSDSEAVLELLKELGRESDKWIRATWDKEQLPDNFNALFDEPTNVDELSPAELLKAVSDQAKPHIAKWAQEQLFWRRNWVERQSNDLSSVLEMDEAEFNERKRKSAADEDYFFTWSLMPSFRVCLENVLGLYGGTTSYPEWLAHHDEMAEWYEVFYENYAEVIEMYPDEDKAQTSLSSIWKSPEDKKELYEKAWKVFQKIDSLPIEPAETDTETM